MGGEPVTRRPIRILHLDDNELDAELIGLAVEMAKDRIMATVRHVATREQFLAALRHPDFDIILSDHRMPGFDGDAALAAARQWCPEIPFIIVSGDYDERKAIEALQRGAADYVLKDAIFRLVPAITQALKEADDRRKRREAQETLRSTVASQPVGDERPLAGSKRMRKGR